MNERTTIGAGDDRASAATRVEHLLSGQLASQKAFAEMADTARWELVRKSLILLLSIALKRILQ